MAVKFPSYRTIEVLYNRNAYTNLQISRFVELGVLTEEEYESITGDKYAPEDPEETQD